MPTSKTNRGKKTRAVAQIFLSDVAAREIGRFASNPCSAIKLIGGYCLKPKATSWDCGEDKMPLSPLHVALSSWKKKSRQC